MKIFALTLIIIFGSIKQCFCWGAFPFLMNSVDTSGGQVCSDSTDYVGGKSGTYNSIRDLNIDTIYATPFTPNCVSGCSSGHLSDALIQHEGVGTDNIKVCLYLDDGDSTPDSDDSLVECVAITSAVSEDASEASAGSAINCSSTYFVVYIPDTTKFNTYRDIASSSTIYYLYSSGSYSSPPSTLTGSWSSVSDAEHKVWFTITE